VKKGCGFEVLWGPIRTKDLKGFIQAGMKATIPMRRVTFTIAERLVLVPVELSFLKKPLLWALPLIFLISGIGPEIFSFGSAWVRGILAVWALTAGILAGTTMTPVLLPWLPGRAFSVKGSLSGFFAGVLVVLALWSMIGILEGLALLLFATAVGSFLAMNFTGATPFTSPSGVEKEMRKAMPLQLAGLLAAIVLWVTASFAA
jgi:hypothetical protein